MHLKEISCSVLVLVIVCSSYVQSNIQVADKRIKRIEKRNTEILVDNYSYETNVRPSVIFKKVSYSRPRPKAKRNHRAPSYRPGKPVNKSPKKYPPNEVQRRPGIDSPRKQKQKFIVPAPVVSPQPRKKPKHAQRYLSPPRNALRPVKSIGSANEKEPVGFGEPPEDYKPSVPMQYIEYPVDSFGIPLRPSSERYQDDPILYESSNVKTKVNGGIAMDYADWTNIADTEYSFTDKQPDSTKPITQNSENDLPLLGTYSDVFSFASNRQRHSKEKKSKKILNTPWKSSQNKGKSQIMVGGQYAEPPARYLAVEPTVSLFTDDTDDLSPVNPFVDHEISQTVSPYVNYKNSNMAFSPQNLNDAFSIVDK